MDYLPFPGYTDPDDLEIPNSPVEVQSRALKEAINYIDINFKFLSGRRNLLYGEAPLTNTVKNILDINGAPNEEKKGSFLVRSIFLQLTTTVTWNYQPEHYPGVLRLWITSVEQTSSTEAKQHLSVVKLPVINREEESKEQFYQRSNQYIDNKNSIVKEGVELLNSDKLVTACLACVIATLMFSFILFSLLNFRDKLQQEQRQQTILFDVSLSSKLRPFTKIFR